MMMRKTGKDKILEDKNISLMDLKENIQSFNRERDWEQYHSPKNTTISISIEAAELLELFQWNDHTAQDVIKKPGLMNRVKEEIADIMIYVLGMANTLNIDVSAAVTDKLRMNAKKYPVEECRGKSEKYYVYMGGNKT